jgi:hypothetical protein
MKRSEHAAGQQHSEASQERLSREAALDETIEASFPASDPSSTDRNPDAQDALEKVPRADRATPSDC